MFIKMQINLRIAKVLYPVILILILAQQADSYSKNYPSCIKDIQQQFTQDYDTNSNNNFIKLSSFLFPSESYPQLLTEIKQNIKQGQLDFESFSLSAGSNSTDLQSVQQSQTVQQFKISYFVVFGVAALGCLLLLRIRAKGGYHLQLRNFMGGAVDESVGGCLVIVGGVWVMFVSVYASYIYKYPIYTSSIHCSQRYMKQLILHGNNNTNWAGLYGIQNMIQTQITLLKNFSQVASQYKFQLLPINNRKYNVSSFADQFYKLFKDGQFQFNDGYSENTFTAKYRELLPELFSENSSVRTLFNKLNQSIHNLYIASQYSTNIETLLSDLLSALQSNSTSIINSLKSKLKFYEIPAKLVQNSQIFSQSVLSPKSAQSYSVNELIILLSRVFIAVGLQGGLMYVFFVIVAGKVRNQLIGKIVDCLWVLLLVLFLMCLVLVFLFVVVVAELSYKCPIMQQIRINKTMYNSYSGTSTASKNLFLTFQPCLFSQNPKLASLPHLEYDTSSLTYLLSNLSSFTVSMINPRQDGYVNLYEYKDVLGQVRDYVEAEIANAPGSRWGYLQGVVDQLGEFTGNWSVNGGCYRHRWVLDVSQCPQNSIILLNNSNNLQLPPNPPANTPTSCLSLSTRTYQQILSNYGTTDTTNPLCSQILNSIKNLTYILSQAIKTKQFYLQGVVNQLQVYNSSLDQFLGILRVNQMGKFQLWKQLATFGHSQKYDGGYLRNIRYLTQDNTNCTVIRQWYDGIYKNLCVDMRADVLKTYIILIVQEFLLACLLIIGAMYGLNKQLRALQRTSIYVGGDQDSGRNDLNESDAVILQKQPAKEKKESRYIRELFEEKRKSNIKIN